MRLKAIRALIVVIFSLFSILTAATAVHAETANNQEKYLTAEVLLKTKASQYYVTRKYERALEEFRQLSREYPEDVIVKRYIGACLYHLKRDEQAIKIFREVLELNPSDLSTRPFLAKMYIRQGNLDEAERELVFILKNNPSGSFVPTAKLQLATIQRSREPEGKVLKAKGRKITPQEFLKTAAANHFVNAEYEDAFTELEILDEQYPGDILITRYKGLTLDKLKRYEEAGKVFEYGLEIVPDNIPLHYFLGQTRLHQKEYDAAAMEFHIVMKKDVSGAYKERSKRDLAATLKIIKHLKKLKGKPRSKKWSYNASLGLEYNTNATSESHEFPSVAEEHAFKLPVSLGGSYRFYRKGPWTGKLTYSHSNAHYSDSITQLNYAANTIGANMTHVQKIHDRPLITQIGQTNTHVRVDGKFYSMKWTQSVLAIYSFADWHRIIVSERISGVNYHTKGTKAEDTSKKGWSHHLSVTNNFYLDEGKRRHLNTIFEHGFDDTEGSYYVKDWFALGGGFHLPVTDLLDFSVFNEWDVDSSIKYKFSNYPDYLGTSRSGERRDREISLRTRFSRMLDEYWKLVLYYHLTDNQSEDETFTHWNHAVGFTIFYRY